MNKTNVSYKKKASFFLLFLLGGGGGGRGQKRWGQKYKRIREKEGDQTLKHAEM